MTGPDPLSDTGRFTVRGARLGDKVLVIRNGVPVEVTVTSVQLRSPDQTWTPEPPPTGWRAIARRLTPPRWRRPLGGTWSSSGGMVQTLGFDEAEGDVT